MSSKKTGTMSSAVIFSTPAAMPPASSGMLEKLETIPDLMPGARSIGIVGITSMISEMFNPDISRSKPM